MAKSPEPPPVPALAPTEGPPLQAAGQPSGSFVCELPNCGAVSICVVPGSGRPEGHTTVPSSKSNGRLAEVTPYSYHFLNELSQGR